MRRSTGEPAGGKKSELQQDFPGARGLQDGAKEDEDQNDTADNLDGAAKGAVRGIPQVLGDAHPVFTDAQ